MCRAALSVISLLVCLLAGFPAAWAQVGGQGGSVYGHVFCADSQKPARFAIVRLQPARAEANGFGMGFVMATTGSDGSFEMTGVAPGEYYVEATLAGYVQPMRGMRAEDLQQLPQAEQDRITAQMTRVSVPANQAVSAQVTIYRGGVLSGTVAYDDGSFAPGVFIMAIPSDPDLTTGAASPAVVRPHRFGNSNQTDDRGRFRITGLPDGVYTVQAWPRTMLPTFLGNTVSRTRAKRVQIRGGDEHSGLDIQVPVVGLHRVAGVVVAQKDGHALPRTSVSLRIEGDAGDTEISTSAGPDGSFVFPTVPDGRYTANVSGAYDQTTHTSYRGTSAEVEVNGADAPDLLLNLMPNQ